MSDGNREFTKLIQLADGTLIEVKASEYETTAIRSGHVEKVSTNFRKSFDRLEPLLIEIGEPIARAFQRLNSKRAVKVKEAEVEVGVNFEAEGQVYVTKSRQDAAIHIKLVLESTNIESANDEKKEESFGDIDEGGIWRNLVRKTAITEREDAEEENLSDEGRIWRNLVRKTAITEREDAEEENLSDDSSTVDREKLHFVLGGLFTEFELRSLCHKLGLAYHDFEGNSNKETIWKLIMHYEKRGRLSELEVKAREVNPRYFE